MVLLPCDERDDGAPRKMLLDGEATVADGSAGAGPGATLMTELHDTATRRCDSVLKRPSNVRLFQHTAEDRSLLNPRGAMSSANEALVRRAIEAIWNQGDLDVADELFAAEYVNHDGLISDLVLGPEAIKISAALHHLAFPDLCVAVEEMSTDEGTVVLRWTARSASVDRTGSRVIASNQKSLTGITRSRCAGGKIVESWTEWDRSGVLGELGLASTP